MFKTIVESCYNFQLMNRLNTQFIKHITVLQWFVLWLDFTSEMFSHCRPNDRHGAHGAAVDHAEAEPGNKKAKR